MNPNWQVIALHTAARRYCMRVYEARFTQYDELRARGRDQTNTTGGRWDYTPKALALFPRYRVAAAILEAVETIAPERLDDLEELRELLVLAGSADDDYTRSPLGTIDAGALEEERDAYADYVRSFSERELEEVEPLPYRRVLSGPETAALQRDLRERWSIGDGYWFPLSETSIAGVFAVFADAFLDALPTRKLQRILEQRGVQRVFELREFGTAHYECDIELFEPVYTGAEGYWSAAPFDWIVYASHENTITFGGWLADEIQRNWPAWRAHEWR